MDKRHNDVKVKRKEFLYLRDFGFVFQSGSGL